MIVGEGGSTEENEDREYPDHEACASLVVLNDASSASSSWMRRACASRIVFSAMYSTISRPSSCLTRASVSSVTVCCCTGVLLLGIGFEDLDFGFSDLNAVVKLQNVERQFFDLFQQ